MKITDLRIGNYVNQSKHGILPICSLHGDNTLRLKSDKGSIGCFYATHINPIPLTEQWLKDFGFVYEEWESFSESLNIYTGIMKGYIYKDGLGSGVYGVLMDGKKVTFFGRRNTNARAKKNTWNFEQKGLIPRYVHHLQNIYYTETRIELIKKV